LRTDLSSIQVAVSKFAQEQESIRAALTETQTGLKRHIGENQSEFWQIRSVVEERFMQMAAAEAAILSTRSPTERDKEALDLYFEATNMNLSDVKHEINDLRLEQENCHRDSVDMKQCLQAMISEVGKN